MSAIDQSLDLNGSELFRIANTYGFPTFVKNANSQEVCGDESMHQHMYADRIRRSFPCHTAPATWVSAAFFYEKQAEYSKDKAELIESRLNQSATHFGILPDMQKLKDQVKAAQITSDDSLPDDAFAIIQQFDNGRKERHYRMVNIPETKTAAEYVLGYRDQLCFVDRHKIADKILVKAAEFGIRVERQDELEKLAGRGVCSRKDAAKAIRSRKKFIELKHPVVAVALDKLAGAIELDPYAATSSSVLYDVASTLDQLDHEHNLLSHYGKVGGLERPEDALFAVTEKVATDWTQALVGNRLTGNFYKKSDLERIPIRSIVDSFGESFANEVATAGVWADTDKLAEVVPTLPLPDAEEFDAIAAESGVRPFAQKLAESNTVLDMRKMRKLAQHHLAGTEGSLWSQIKRR